MPYSIGYTGRMNYLESLNEMQKEAVLHTEGPLLVVAGAGTGKTKTLTHRIIHLIKKGTDPRSILAITFTNKAAKEMRERVIAMLGTDDHIPTMSTFHSLGVRILRDHHTKIGVNKYFNILDSQDKGTLIKQAMRIQDINPKEWEPRKIASTISPSIFKRGVYEEDFNITINSTEFYFFNPL